MISDEELKEIRRMQEALLKLPSSHRVDTPGGIVIRLLDMIEELQVELKAKSDEAITY